MNAGEFLKEVLESELCPDGFESIYEDFSRYQKMIMDILVEFHRICEGNGVRYQLTFGSLLGAIRDGGQIPWDYDVDVIVPSADRRKLIKALRKDLDEQYYLNCIELNKKCSHVIFRIAPKGYDSEFLHIDVFFLSGLPGEQEEDAAFRDAMVKTTLLYKAKKFSVFNRGAATNRETARMMKYRLLGAFKTPKSIFEEYRELAQKYPLQDAQQCCLADRYARGYTFPATIFDDSILWETSVGTFRIPQNYEEILGLMYTDHKAVPPLENRLRELLLHYDRLVRHGKAQGNV